MKRIDLERHLREEGCVLDRQEALGLSVLDYRVTSNHIRLLVKDMGVNVIAESMQLIGSRTVQEYNRRGVSRCAKKAKLTHGILPQKMKFQARKTVSGGTETLRTREHRLVRSKI